ncbi:MAG: hypothetical protein NTZ09_07180 [Candidatus Hydrogenedentes bacterium]|nr:hypothetical protein [Candidatus Hydrogenedentota bacterium]
MAAGGAFFWTAAASVFICACLLLSGCPESAGRVGNDVCLTCHQGTLAPDQRSFVTGTHRFLDCETCHGDGLAHVRNGGRGGLFIFDPRDEPFRENDELCERCHPGEAGQYVQSVHFEEEAVRCTGCHDVHEASETRRPFIDNSLCLHCHAEIEFPTVEDIVAHTFHPYDPTGTRASRCVPCHMPPLRRQDQADGPHSHTFEPIRPIRSNEAMDAGVFPAPPNSCAGIMGCHDGTVPTAPVFNVDNPQDNIILQTIFDERYGEEEED